MKLQKLLFVDLDNTLFQTAPKCGGEGALEIAALLQDGSACSYTTKLQREALQFFTREMVVIPTTARSHGAFQRVLLPFESYAIIDYGGVVLMPGGEPDKVWLDVMQAELAEAAAPLPRLQSEISRYIEISGDALRARMISDFGVDFYIVIKSKDGALIQLDSVEQDVIVPWVLRSSGAFRCHRNGNNLVVIPRILDKSRAVEHVARCLQKTYGDVMTFGMGDSDSDLSFMSACDFSIIPRDSQLIGSALAHQRFKEFG